MTGGPERIVLVGGHESADGADLRRFEDGGGLRIVATAAGRALDRAVSSALADGDTVVVVPMTFGRNRTMVADAAKTLKWLAAKHPLRIALAAPFGQSDHMTAWLRAAANRAGAKNPGSALLIVAPHSNPFDEAELHRIAYLVATHGALPEVHAVIADDAAEISAAAARMRMLGLKRVIAVPAGFAVQLPAGEDVESAGPLMSDAAIRRVIRTRARDAVAALAAGESGIDAGLMADHGHGYAHSHAFELGEGSTRLHPHPHAHADGTVHTHDASPAHHHGTPDVREAATASTHDHHA